MALNSTEKALLTRLGYPDGKGAPSGILATVSSIATKVDSGQIESIDAGLVEARAIIEGRSTSQNNQPFYGYPAYPSSAPGGNPAAGGTGATTGGEVNQIKQALMLGGFTSAQADQLMLEDLNKAYQIAQDILEGTAGGSGGGTGRTQFESESRLQNAQAAQIEQEMAAIAAGTSRLQPFQGGFYDPYTGQMVDPSDLGVNKFNADTSRMNATTQSRLADFQTGPQFQEGIRQFDQTLGLQALGEERMGKTAAANAEIGFGNLGIDRAKFITDVLSKPSDTLARLYMQRGGVSPLGKIEMADILNSFNTQASNISQSASRFMPGGGGGGAIKPTPLVPPVVPKPAVTPAINPEYKYANSPFITPTYSDPNNYLSPEGDPWSDAAQSRWDQGIEEGSIALADPAATPDNYQYDPNGGLDAVSDYNFEIQDGNLVAVPAHARGGYTQESRFIVGDQRSGKPTGHEELIVNPTNAPIQVVPNKALPRNVSRYEDGTSAGDIRKKTLDAKPTGGFLNSLKEALGDLGEGFSRFQDSNRATTKQGLADFPIDRDAAVGTAMGVAGHGGGMFSRMSPAERLKFAESKGVKPDQLPLQDQFAKARQEVADLTQKFMKSNDKNAVGGAGELTLARKKADTLKKMIDEQRDAVKTDKRDFDQQMMDDVSDSFKLWQTMSKQADKVTEMATGGLYKTAKQAQDRMAQLKEMFMSGGQMDDQAYKEWDTLTELLGKPAFGVLRRAEANYSSLTSQLGRMKGGLGDIEQIDPGLSLGDSLQKAQEPISRFAGGTLGDIFAGTSQFDPSQYDKAGYEPWFGSASTSNDYNIYPSDFKLDKSRIGDVHYGSSTIPTYNDTHSLFPTGDVTQQQLIDMSRIGTGPGGTSVLSGQMPDYFRIPGLQTPTAMQFNSLSGAERENLRPRLAAEFNSTLEDLMFDIEQRFTSGPSRMSRFRG